ncbi:BZ3500_MvSof-1268-A1-R1_Chr3-1g05657 [Microbotryum saponariae]|uniref:BZ3500_MvSof-1268-A1-R1_Chr3-1g05657 protein n=1 Tax=Microbotryum saponariae TaxID=289078 RepID=A0A2X0LRH2_9BASI|nr:BZ3500_MvSof-1268-A1-R1_Chr3-1g05657 [Microbotryum saponariae]SDA04847.1 BZ3501_MvSof-1269-A2-R1_Chr3-1g05327 [Microbotryum saponariae]
MILVQSSRWPATIITRPVGSDFPALRLAPPRTRRRLVSAVSNGGGERSDDCSVRNKRAYLIRSLTTTTNAVVKAIESFADFKTIINSDKIVVIDFWATCMVRVSVEMPAGNGPCKVISPVFEQLEKEHPNLEFYKVDVDTQEDIASECAIKAMPTFIFFQNGEKKGTVVGAAKDKLVAALQMHSESA